MNADLEKLIALQKIDSEIHAAQKRLASEPERLKALDARLEAARQRVTDAKARQAANRASRGELEKNAAVHQGRLSKYRDQAMNVKTNQEYHAIQHEMAFAQTEIKTIEDKELELMMEADEITAAVKEAETTLAADQKAVDAERASIAAESTAQKALVARLQGERAGVVGGITPSVMSIFDRVARARHGVAMAEARDGICVVCHVRMRPQVFMTVRRNEEIMQCESCHRILYFVPQPAASPAAS
jgi:predicted  nucleic acid-binding Zn-ribbon protein